LGSPEPDRRYRPTDETTAAAQAGAPMRSCRNAAPMTGVSTTNRPVMKAALDAVVSSSPRVWRM